MFDCSKLSLSRKLFLRLTPNTTSEVGHFLKPTTLVPDPNQKQLKKKTEFKIQFKPKNIKSTKDLNMRKKHIKINFKNKSYFAGKPHFWFKIFKNSRTKTMHLVRFMLGSSKRSKCLSHKVRDESICNVYYS